MTLWKMDVKETKQTSRVEERVDDGMVRRGVEAGVEGGRLGNRELERVDRKWGKWPGRG
jgi:hypothetical protein